MAIQEYISSESFKQLIDDKLVNADSVKSVLKKRGILPVCTSSNALSEMVHTIFLGTDALSEIHQILNFEQNNLKSTMLVISPTNEETTDFINALSDEFVKLQRIPQSLYKLKNIHADKSELHLQYCYTKPQKGRIKMLDKKDITLDVKIAPLTDGKYKVNIRHDGISESKQFVSLLEKMVSSSQDDQIFNIRRITLNSLQKKYKVDFFDKFGSYKHTEWTITDITNVTMNKDDKSIDDDSSDELDENEPMGKLTGISSAILHGGGLRNNDFVKECMEQSFIFSSMRYKFSHKSLPIIVELDITFKQTDLKINVTRTWRTEDDGLDYLAPLLNSEQNEYIDYFQNIAYKIYSDLIKSQKEELQRLHE